MSCCGSVVVGWSSEAVSLRAACWLAVAIDLTCSSLHLTSRIKILYYSKKSGGASASKSMGRVYVVVHLHCNKSCMVVHLHCNKSCMEPPACRLIGSLNVMQ